MFMDTRRNLTASLIDVPSRRCRGEGERTMFAVTTGMRRRCVTVRYDRCTRMCGVVNRRTEHATDRWGTYLYSLMMIFAFSKEALLEYREPTSLHWNCVTCRGVRNLAQSRTTL